LTTSQEMILANIFNNYLKYFKSVLGILEPQYQYFLNHLIAGM
jgi:hypothetical protein